MRPYLHDDFLLSTPESVRLYHEFAAAEPIYDYHTHLSPKEIAEDRRYENLTEVWLGGDHYKWRAMRANGVPESHVTGNASPKEKFLAWADTVPHTLRNPLYHWTHLELKRVFGIDLLLGPDTAEEIWGEANARLEDAEFSARGLMKKFQVKLVCGTDDPADPLSEYERIAADKACPVRAYPTFRPDMALKVDQPENLRAWLERLASVSGKDTGGFAEMLEALRSRHEDFHRLGGRLSDHGLTACLSQSCDGTEAARIFDKALASEAVSAAEKEAYGSFLMRFFAHLDAEKDWCKQLHLGPRRNNNTRLFQKLGADIGCDSIGEAPQVDALCQYLDQLEGEGCLPKMVVYNIHPKDNYALATAIGNFQGRSPGRLQFGSGWWFLDCLEGMEWQINALSHTGLLSRFVGMLTDSRSFLSAPRHEYFRRILCDLLGRDMHGGRLPSDFDLVGGMARRICFANAKDYFGMETA